VVKKSSMAHTVKIRALTKDQIEEYIRLGVRSYTQHYLDFWEDEDSSPFINDSFTRAVVEADLSNPNAALFIIESEGISVGVLKILLNEEVASFSKDEALLLQKLYILQESSGQGIGKEVLKLSEAFAKERNKKVLWLDAMVKSKAVSFYLQNGYTIVSSKEVGYKSVKPEKKGMYVFLKKL